MKNPPGLFTYAKNTPEMNLPRAFYFREKPLEGSFLILVPGCMAFAVVSGLLP